MILVIDNYDSFTYNLVQHIGELGADPIVFRNDAITVDEVLDRRPGGIVISPGPGRPEDAGVSMEVVRRCSGRVPILGVCLGHQSIGAAFGARVTRTTPLHGKGSSMRHNGAGVFRALGDPISAGRYHSLVVERDGLPDCLEVTATTDDGLVMGLAHREDPTWGVQFHPESILTPDGKRLVANFLAECGEGPAAAATREERP